MNCCLCQADPPLPGLLRRRNGLLRIGGMRPVDATEAETVLQPRHYHAFPLPVKITQSLFPRRPYLFDGHRKGRCNADDPFLASAYP